MSIEQGNTLYLLQGRKEIVRLFQVNEPLDYRHR